MERKAIVYFSPVFYGKTIYGIHEKIDAKRIINKIKRALNIDYIDTTTSIKELITREDGQIKLAFPYSLGEWIKEKQATLRGSPINNREVEEIHAYRERFEKLPAIIIYGTVDKEVIRKAQKNNIHIIKETRYWRWDKRGNFILIPFELSSVEKYRYFDNPHEFTKLLRAVFS